uniref:40S ribosomal protein S30 n=1 Tax=Toxocara canis TaxID=6265 RepID=A0A183VBA3_TOXCA
LDEDNSSLSQLDVVHGSSLNINARLIGGKVHGSLARAGKVRAQTPKVDKQEKKKKKTGYMLTFGTRILDEDNSSLSQLEIMHGSSLNVNARLMGGKVHGSLARAGKVRAQTPKVDKQEKKKKKTGRAARRIQYNRRFVNVALSGPGRKRGPNSNAT